MFYYFCKKNIFLKTIYSIFSFLFFSLILSAQNSDSGKVIIKTPVVEYFQGKNFFPNNSDYTSIDTSLDGIQKYFPNNFPYSLGLSNRKLFFEPSSEIGFRSGFESLDLFGYNRDEIKYYRTRTPYTEIFALFGMKKEQFARLLHTQNITKQWNIALNMLRLRSDGFYNRQNCTDNNISLSSNYTSKNNRYSLLANGIINSIKTDENGGVQDNVFETNLFVNKKRIPVNLLEARTRRGHREFSLTQFLNFGKRDSVKGDSTMRYRIYPKSSFSYSFNVNDSWFVYNDKNPTSGFYQNIFKNSTETLDSTHIFTFQNGVSWKYRFRFSGMAIMDVSLKQKKSRLTQYNIDTLLTDNSINIEFRKDTSYYNHFENIFWKAGGKYILKGKNKQDEYCFYFGGYQYLIPRNGNKNNLISAQFDFYSQANPYIYSSYLSNNFQWLNTFDNTSQTLGGKITYENKKINLAIGVESHNITGYVYFDSIFSPQQFNDTLSINCAFIQKKFHLKKFNFNNKITWQQASEDVIHLPQFVTNHSLYYADKWFKKATDVQIGFDVTYFTSYYADSYMPALGQYYLQDEKKIGNYPFIDFFFNMKVKHARIFFKTEHVNSGLMGAYYLAPHIPAPDRSLKVGVNWMFYD
ncbi:MAG: putative porin [Bacteroidota bacterium]